MHPVIPLLSDKQHTLKKATDWVYGTTLRGIPAQVRFRPLPSDTGRTITVQVKGVTLFTVAITLASGRLGHTWTDAVDEHGNGVAVVEHPGAAVVLAGLDNVDMMVNYPDRRAASLWYGKAKCSSVPLMNGTAAPYLQRILEAGVIAQGSQRHWQTVQKRFEFDTGSGFIVLEPRSKPGWSLKVSNPPSKASWKKDQLESLFIDLTDPQAPKMLHAVSASRPANSSYAEWLVFHLLTLGTGRKADFAALFGPFSKRPIHNQAPYSNYEAIDHKTLDILADLFYFGGFWNMDITISNGGHANMDKFRNFVNESVFRSLS